MPGRTRRVRLLLLTVFGLIVVSLWHQKFRSRPDYEDYITAEADRVTRVGGGSVLRPKYEEDPRYPYPPGWFGDEEQPPEDQPPEDQPPEDQWPDDQWPEDQPPEDQPEEPEQQPESRPEPEPEPTPAPEKAPGAPQGPLAEPAIAEKTPDTAPKGDTPDTALGEDTPIAKPHGALLPSHDNDINEDPGNLDVDRGFAHDEPVQPIPDSYWIKQPEHFPVSTTIQLPTGSSIPFPKIQRAEKKLAAAGVDKEKLAIVKATAEHSWKGYREVAFGADEVKPVSGEYKNPFNGWGATLVDSLDTLWIMGMVDEFDEAAKKVDEIDFTTSPRPDIPIFEITIRYLGGLLSAYDVSGKQEKYRNLLDKAVELAEIMYGAFDTPNRMPVTYYNWQPSFASQPHRAKNRVVMAELGSLSLEFTRLAQIAKEPKYYDAVARITTALYEWQNSTRLPGMWPTVLDASGCGTPSHIPIASPVDRGNQMPVPNRPGRMMVAGEAVRWDADNVPAPVLGARQRQSLQQKVGNNATLNQGGASKSHDVGDASGDGLPDSSDVQANPLSSFDLGSTKRKRDRHQVKTHDRLLSRDEHGGLTSEVPTNNAQRSGSRQRSGLRAPQYEDTCIPKGLSSSTRMSMESFTLGGQSDSTYEYLSKAYLLLGGRVEEYKTMYLDSMKTVIDNLLFKPMTIDERDILVSGEVKSNYNFNREKEGEEVGDEFIDNFHASAEHLTCFAGGMFAMGGVIFNQPEHVEIGSKLTDGCVWMYNVTNTGIMPEGLTLLPCDETWGECRWNQTKYWAALDPYAESRTAVHKPVPSPAALKPSNSSSPAAGTVADPEGPLPKPKVGEVEKDADSRGSGPSSDGLKKRQLDDVHGPEPLPLPVPLDAEGPEPLPLPVPLDDPTPSISEVPIYTPPPPVSHEEFVTKKIESERLPPGMVRVHARNYILRPEAIESVFYMYRITGDQYWREVGWNMFTAIDRNTRAPHGNSAIDDVTKEVPELMDSMESFWLAETLKYFYLLYDDPDAWSLDDWVLNTEAHPFRRPPYEFASNP